ncbi:MAG TPA: NADH-quinone oxidoreductase subunit N [Anaerolineales bacterium]|nr:NADH-quinone oxidoreductase subunit N [Anaerolineales bacterium]
MTATDFLSVLPLTILVAWACVLTIADLFIGRKLWTAVLAGLGLATALVVAVLTGGETRVGFNGMVSADGFAVFVSVLLLASGMVAVGLLYGYSRRMGFERGEIYTLLLFSMGGMVLMAYAADLIAVFLALELFSIPLYILAGIARPRSESEESALKYFLIGAFSSAIMVYGIALVYAATGATALSGIVAALGSPAFNVTLFSVGGGLVLVGFGFKVGAVPFHMWIPDVYQGAPSAVTAFMAVGAKAAGFAALLRVFVTAFSTRFDVMPELTTVIWWMSALTMIVGNVLAVSQKNIKRLLAYSSISHAGFILMAFTAYGQESVAADSVASALFYLLAFAVTSYGVWAIVMSLEQVEDGDDGMRKGLNLDDYAGLGQRHPALALAMTIFMLSFIGLPPTLGFAGKLYLFRTAIAGGFYSLAVIGVLTSLISAYYYLKIVVIMYMVDGEPQVHKARMLGWTVGVSAVGTVVLTIFASPLFAWAAGSVLELFR